MRTHEVPTHLHVDDRILAGLTVRQALAVALGAACAYWLWEHAAVPVLARASCPLWSRSVGWSVPWRGPAAIPC